LKLFRKKPLHGKKLSLLILLFYTLIFGCSNLVLSSQENYFEEMELNNNTKDGYESNNALPTNPFELVDMIRRANSMNDATNPSDAIDEAIKSYDDIKLKNN
tara:strand:- start:23 stop:328 length:306 start_codon:yes stop_codon:yes gene_type:complete